MFECIFILFAVILVFIVYSVSSNHQYFRRFGVPQTSPVFFYGDYKEVLHGKKHNSVKLKEIYDENKKNRYVGFYKLNTPAILLNDPEIIKNVLIKDFDHFNRNNVKIDTNDPFHYYNPFFAVDDEWKEQRQILSSNVTLSKTKLIFKKLQGPVEHLVEYLNDICEKYPEREVCVKEVAENYMTDILSIATVGLEVNSFKDPNSSFRKITQSIVVSPLLKNIMLFLELIYPVLGRFANYSFIDEDQKRDLTKIIKEAIQSRKDTGKQNNDLLQQLLKLREKYPGKGISDAHIGAHVYAFILNNYETAITTINFAIFELGKNLDVQEKLREEIDNSCQENDGEIVYNELVNLKYLDMVLSETLRRHTPVLSIEKLCTKTYKLPPASKDAKPLEIYPGTAVVIPIYALHMDERYFPQPEKFNPENFNTGSEESRPKCAYLPFGEGPRMCLGFLLGLTQVKMAIATILRNFEVQTSASSIESGYTISPNVFVKTPRDKIMVHFHKRY